MEQQHHPGHVVLIFRIFFLFFKMFLLKNNFFTSNHLFGSFRPSGFGLSKPFYYLTVLILPKSPFLYPKDLFLKIFLNKSRYPKIFFMPNPLENLLLILGTCHFSKFQSQKVKNLMSFEKTYIFLLISLVLIIGTWQVHESFSESGYISKL